eukprot:GFYU01015914.1.p1 GENE.GFYU01015914.1~~GFYU01015914.1.p1  ORF type:complete len:173 (-),score=56.87 GFYU01015914.1:714-1232(-)
MGKKKSVVKLAGDVDAAGKVTKDYLTLAIDSKLINGMHLTEEVSGKEKVVFSTDELDIGVVYVTEEGNALVRTSKTECVLDGSTVIEVKKNEVLVKEAAAVKIQSQYRGMSARQEIDQQHKAASKIQATFKGNKTRQELANSGSKRRTLSPRAMRSGDKGTAACGKGKCIIS